MARCGRTGLAKVGLTTCAVLQSECPHCNRQRSPRVQEVTTRFTPCPAAVTLITLDQSKQHAAGLMLTWCQKFFKICIDVDIDVPALCLSFSQFLDAGNPILHAAYSAQKGKKLRKSSELCRVVNPEWRRTSAGRRGGRSLRNLVQNPPLSLGGGFGCRKWDL